MCACACACCLLPPEHHSADLCLTFPSVPRIPAAADPPLFPSLTLSPSVTAKTETHSKVSPPAGEKGSLSFNPLLISPRGERYRDVAKKEIFISSALKCEALNSFLAPQLEVKCVVVKRRHQPVAAFFFPPHLLYKTYKHGTVGCSVAFKLTRK